MISGGVVSTSNSEKIKAAVVVRAKGGLVNRLRMVLSFKCYAEAFHRPFFVCWDSGQGWSNERFSDLFQNTLPFISRRQFDEFSRNAVRLDELAYSEPNAGIKVRSPIFVERLLDSNSILSYYGHERFDDLLFGDAIPDSLRTGDRYESEVRSLEPVDHLFKEIDRVSARFTDATIGLHLRRGDAFQTRCRNLYMRSSDSAFVKAIEENIERDNDVSFFLATDCQETQFMLQSRFGKRIITNERKRFVKSELGKPKQNQSDAVIDLWLLSRTARILGTNRSSFSRLASIRGNIELKFVMDSEDNHELRIADSSRLNHSSVEAIETPDLTIVSGANSRDGWALRNLLHSISLAGVRAYRIVYDLGLSEQQVDVIRKQCDELRTLSIEDGSCEEIKGSSERRPIILSEVITERDGLVLWLDSTSLVYGDLRKLKEFLRRNGFYSPIKTGKIRNWVHPQTLHLLQATTDLLDKRVRDCSVIGVDSTAPGIRELVATWKRVSFHDDCIGPQCSGAESERGESRRDEATFSVLAHKFRKQSNFELVDERIDIATQLDFSTLEEAESLARQLSSKKMKLKRLLQNFLGFGNLLIRSDK